MKDVEDLIYDLYDYYMVDNNIELSKKIATTPQTISNWKTRNSVSAIKKKCRELGIYNEIFRDSSISITQGRNGRAAGRDYQEGIKAQESSQFEFEETTISLIKDLINKIGEVELQSKLLELKRNV